MFQNYFKLAWRNLIKDKFFSFVNLFGLALAFGVASLLWIFVPVGLIAGIVAIITLGFQAVKVATANPVKSLKSE